LAFATRALLSRISESSSGCPKPYSSPWRVAASSTDKQAGKNERRTAMPQDPRDAQVTARVFFEGIMLMCVTNPDRPGEGHHADNRCEVGFLRCPRHKARISVVRRGPTIRQEFSKFYDITHDVYFQVVNPQTPGVILHDEGDAADFKLLPDLEGVRLHSDKVDILATEMLARLAVNAGELYAHSLSAESYDLMRWTDMGGDGARVRVWGELVEDLCLNIICRDEANSGINIYNAAKGNLIEQLPRLPDAGYYEIKVENDCGETSFGTRASDFRFYYDVVTAKDSQRFDFTKALGAPSPHICEGAYLSQTRSLGFDYTKVPSI
jgi:hypothetical protein